jgi:hypothetical protein
VSAHEAGVADALAQIREWHPAFTDASDDEIRRAPLHTDAARLVYAHQHGFGTWNELIAPGDPASREWVIGEQLLGGRNPGESDSERRHDQARGEEHHREDECLIKRQIRCGDALHALTLDLDRPRVKVSYCVTVESDR